MRGEKECGKGGKGGSEQRRHTSVSATRWVVCFQCKSHFGCALIVLTNLQSSKDCTSHLGSSRPLFQLPHYLPPIPSSPNFYGPPPGYVVPSQQPIMPDRRPNLTVPTDAAITADRGYVVSSQQPIMPDGCCNVMVPTDAAIAADRRD